MADIDPQAVVADQGAGAGEAAEKSAETKGPDTARELAELRGRFTVMETGYKKDMEAGKRERDILVQQINASRTPVATQIDAIQKEIDKTYEEKGFTAGFYKASMDLLDKPITAQFELRDAKINGILDRFGKHQRYDVKRDERCTPELMLAVDAVMEKLSPEERAEPGAYRECLDQLLEREEIADLKLRSAGDQSRVISRKGTTGAEDDAPALTAEEHEWARRSDMTDKEYIKWRDVKEIDPYA